jgi:hypothetical protein
VYLAAARPPGQCGLAPDHRVDELADLGDVDPDLIAGLQGEWQIGNEAGPRGQDRASRELLLADV